MPYQTQVSKAWSVPDLISCGVMQHYTQTDLPPRCLLLQKCKWLFWNRPSIHTYGFQRKQLLFIAATDIAHPHMIAGTQYRCAQFEIKTGVDRRPLEMYINHQPVSLYLYFPLCYTLTLFFPSVVKHFVLLLFVKDAPKTGIRKPQTQGSQSGSRATVNIAMTTDRTVTEACCRQTLQKIYA